MNKNNIFKNNIILFNEINILLNIFRLEKTFKV